MDLLRFGEAAREYNRKTWFSFWPKITNTVVLSTPLPRLGKSKRSNVFKLKLTRLIRVQKIIEPSPIIGVGIPCNSLRMVSLELTLGFMQNVVEGETMKFATYVNTCHD